MRLAEGILELRESLRERCERWFEGLKAFERVAQAFAGNAKIVKLPPFATFEPNRQRASFSQTGSDDSCGEPAHVLDAIEIDSCGFHGALRGKTHSAQFFARLPGGIPLSLAQAF